MVGQVWPGALGTLPRRTWRTSVGSRRRAGGRAKQAAARGRGGSLGRGAAGAGEGVVGKSRLVGPVPARCFLVRQEAWAWRTSQARAPRRGPKSSPECPATDKKNPLFRFSKKKTHIVG